MLRTVCHLEEVIVSSSSPAVAMETALICLLHIIYVVASSNVERCPPPPEVMPSCDVINPDKNGQSSRVSNANCNVTGCLEGQVCCSDYCGGYHCVQAYKGPTSMCPPGASKCTINHPIRMRIGPSLMRYRKQGLRLTHVLNDIFSTNTDTCKNHSDCKPGMLCCLVNCRKRCIKGLPVVSRIPFEGADPMFIPKTEL